MCPLLSVFALQTSRNGLVGVPAERLYGDTESVFTCRYEVCRRPIYARVYWVIHYLFRRILTHGPLELQTQRGRQASKWLGALAEIATRLSSSCHNLTNRNGRFDLTLPRYVVDALNLERKLEPILVKLRTIMGKRIPQIRTHNVVFAPVGSTAQDWHYDVIFFFVYINSNDYDGLYRMEFDRHQMLPRAISPS